MKKTLASILAAGLAGGSLVSCGETTQVAQDEQLGTVQVALTKVPNDASCVRVTVAGSRTIVRSFDVVAGADSTFSINQIPAGIVQVSGEAFASACAAVGAASVPSYVSESPVPVRVDRSEIVKVLLKLIRNGRLSVGLDFEDGPIPYVVPSAPGVLVRDFLTVGDSVGGYKMAGIPDGQGAFDNGDGTFSLLVNHELGATVGVPRAHGPKGSFISKWTVRKSDLTVLAGEDLIKKLNMWDPATNSYALSTTFAIGRMCSADLPDLSAFYDAASGLGYNGRIFMNGEETGAEGKAFAHVLDGNSYELPYLGKFSWENAVASPASGVKTVVVGTDDSGGGQIYVYVGDKTNAGLSVDKAGLTNGKLYGLKAVGFVAEDAATGIPSGTPVELVEIPGIAGKTGVQLETESNTLLVTKFARPEDGVFDPKNPNDFYFVTTASFTTSTRLWRVRFNDIKNPLAGAKIDLLVDGAVEGGKMFDNITMDKFGHVYLQEDIGGQDPLSKLWRYDVATDKLTEIAKHNPVLFTPGAPLFLTRDEESSGIIDASDILGQGWFLGNVQAHYAHPDPALVEGGQLFAIFDPESK